MQLDGVEMGSPLGPALANIFVDFHDSRHFDNTAKPGVYFWHVGDSFVLFGSELCGTNIYIYTHTWGSKVLHSLLNFNMVDMCKQKLMHKSSHFVWAICLLWRIEISIGQSLKLLATKI